MSYYSMCLWERKVIWRGLVWKKMMPKTFKSRPPLLVQEDFAMVAACQKNIAHEIALMNSLNIMAETIPHLLFSLYTLYRDHVLKARIVEEAVLSSPFRLLGSNRTGVVLTYPVYRSNLSSSMCSEGQFV
ncbi:hypothetical protein ACJRO7_003737 [Eucalyptus globulus]|uniref:CHASE domain-containing protein n=1 Tax=Eucalyptus globulus TaxID=34317 RepID=A0ABD3IWS8_EUCGL